MKRPLIHLVGEQLAPELQAFAREVQRYAVVYRFDSAEEMLAGWRLARRNAAAGSMNPTAVVWLQSRSGEFSQAEIDATQTLDPLARSVVVAGVWSEGEPRSGRPLTGAKRIYWHQGWSAVSSLLSHDDAVPFPARWIAIHTPQFVDYLGLAGACHSLGQRTIWQSDRGPAISSEPDVRLFDGWDAWESWRSLPLANLPTTPAVLVLNFPRPADFARAERESIARIVATPFATASLHQAIESALAAPRHLQISRPTENPQTRQNLTAIPRRRSA